MSKKFCFCTLAVGNRYRTHARMLASDIQKHSPATSLIVLTDQPHDFEEYPHVIACKHRLQSVKGYHDKRFVLEKSLKLFDTCMYLDSDVRILGSVPEDIEWLPGITARTGCKILKHNAGMNQRQALPVIKKVAQKLDIDLEKTQWFHEFMFAVKKQDGAEVEFLKLWQTISYFFEMQGIYDGEGNVMGLAAVLAGLTVQFDSGDKFPFFKDNIEQVRIKKGQSQLKDKQIYFDIHKKIEYPEYPIWRKVINKLIGKAVFLYRLFRLRTFARQDLGF
ncbi:hypothetical protein IQ243_16085 [Nostocales cyanobacterium LEGE 11386]|nr:hypothetical protein [Nostocales cyanobacterium LEGE 11386]